MTETTLNFLPDLASRALGGSVVYANDELFAERENLIKAAAPDFSAHTFGHKGQIMDGWETRRRRQPGNDVAIVRLGAAGVIRNVVVDTSYFTGNYPPEVSVEACGVEGFPSPDELHQASWVPVVPRVAVKGNAENEFEVDDAHRYTHVRLTMYPDGGVARLRVRGEIVPDPRLLATSFDVAALENGARVTSASNVFYSSPTNLIMPGNARVMGDGWETSRRRDDGNDWVDVELACAARVEVCELDTSHFVGNAPGWASVRTADGLALIDKRAVQPDTRHRFVVEDAAGQTAVSKVRLDIYPDGGMARLRMIGVPTDAGRDAITLSFLNALPDAHLAAVLAGSGLEPDAAEAFAVARPAADLSTLPAPVRDRVSGRRPS